MPEWIGFAVLEMVTNEQYPSGYRPDAGVERTSSAYARSWPSDHRRSPVIQAGEHLKIF